MEPTVVTVMQWSVAILALVGVMILIGMCLVFDRWVPALLDKLKGKKKTVLKTTAMPSSSSTMADLKRPDHTSAKNHSQAT